VLGVAALDAYAATAFCEKLNPFLRRWGPDKHLIKLLSDAGLDARVALEMIPMDRPHAVKSVRRIVDRRNEIAHGGD